MSITKKQADNTLTMIWFIAKDTKEDTPDATGNVFNLFDLREKTGCGTSACLCGWLPNVDPSVKIKGVYWGGLKVFVNGKEVEGDEAIQHSLGLSESLANRIYDSEDVFYRKSTQRKEVCRALRKHLKQNGYLAPTLKELGF